MKLLELKILVFGSVIKLWKSGINWPDPGINKDAFWIKDSILFSSWVQFGLFRSRLIMSPVCLIGYYCPFKWAISRIFQARIGFLTTFELMAHNFRNIIVIPANRFFVREVAFIWFLHEKFLIDLWSRWVSNGVIFITNYHRILNDLNN